jgi:DNA polymerase-3 subunit epsilon
MPKEVSPVGAGLSRCTFSTVAASRRIFPGLKSYGLADLTKEFGIELESHHRALCDARATAEILQRINEERKRRAIGT